MNANIDLKNLWNQEQTLAPDVKEIFAKGAKLQSRTRYKVIFNTIIPLTLIAAFTSLIWLYRQPQMTTTKLGLALVIGAMAFFITAAMRYLNLLNKNNTDSNVNEFLLHFLKVKQRQESLSTTMLSIYFALLTGGFALCMVEYVERFNITIQLSAYVIVFAWIAFNWFYLIPRMVKKQRDKMTAIIEKLETLNERMAAQ